MLDNACIVMMTTAPTMIVTRIPSNMESPPGKTAVAPSTPDLRLHGLSTPLWGEIGSIARQDATGSDQEGIKAGDGCTYNGDLGKRLYGSPRGG